MVKGEKEMEASKFAWQVIVVQARGGQKQDAPPVPLQATITYGDSKDSTPFVEERQPLWNLWTQMPDRGGKEPMLFSLVEKDDTTGKMFVRGAARLDLTKYRRCGKSFEMWEALSAPRARSGSGFVSKPGPVLHLTITYCRSDSSGDRSVISTQQHAAQGEDTDCQLCGSFAKVECVIS